MTAPTLADLTAGLVLAFTRDLTFLEGRWTSRAPGTHFIVTGEFSSSGAMFGVYNTRTAQQDYLLADSWVLGEMRIIGRLADPEEPQCTCDA